MAAVLRLRSAILRMRAPAPTRVVHQLASRTELHSSIFPAVHQTGACGDTRLEIVLETNRVSVPPPTHIDAAYFSERRNDLCHTTTELICRRHAARRPVARAVASLESARECRLCGNTLHALSESASLTGRSELPSRPISRVPSMRLMLAARPRAALYTGRLVYVY